MSLEHQAEAAIAASKAEERLSRFDLATHRRPFATAIELATYLDCDRRVIVRMIANGSLPGVKVGRTWRIPTTAARVAFHVEQIQAS